MAVYVVVGQHGLYKRGMYVEDIGDGMVQPVTMQNDDGVYKPLYPYGIALPLVAVRDSLLRIQARGLDKSW